MPIKIKTLSIPLPQQLAAFRQSLPLDEGWTVTELAARFKKPRQLIYDACQRKGWFLRTVDERTGRMSSMLVSPATLKKYAKNKS